MLKIKILNNKKYYFIRYPQGDVSLRLSVNPKHRGPSPFSTLVDDFLSKEPKIMGIKNR